MLYTPRVARHQKRYCSRKCYLATTGGTISAQGYVLVFRPQHPHAQRGGQIMQHRVVMEEKLGRLLLPHETVHHINGIKTDNRPENLQLRNGKHGNGWVNRCADCGSYNITHEPLSTTITSGG